MLVLSSSRNVFIDNKETELEVSYNYNDVLSIFKQWLSNLQICSIKKNLDGKLVYSVEEIKSMGLKSLNSIQVIFDVFEDKNLPKVKKITKDGKTVEKRSFHDRILLLKSKENFSQIYDIIKEIKGLTEENVLGKLSEQDAAKRLAIGTQIGKFHNKALKFKGYSVENFDKDKEELVKVLSANKIEYSEFQEASVISLQNQKEVLSETDLFDGLKLCTSQYDLVENMPLIGHSIHVIR